MSQQQNKQPAGVAYLASWREKELKVTKLAKQPEDTNKDGKKNSSPETI